MSDTQPAVTPKPRHLGPDYAAQFSDPAVVVAYHHRPCYPAAVFAILQQLIVDPPRRVLDIGCGTGEIARTLAPHVERVDAVDISLPMIEKGRGSPGGNHPHLTWIVGAVETIALYPPYALVTAGASLHWMEWSVVLPRLSQMLTAHGTVAIIDQESLPTPLDQEMQRLIDRFSTNRDYQPYDLVTELTTRRLFHAIDQRRTGPVPVRQSIEAFVESLHSRNGFSRDRMEIAAARSFDAEAMAVLRTYCPSGTVALNVVGVVVWGRPDSS